MSHMNRLPCTLLALVSLPLFAGVPQDPVQRAQTLLSEANAYWTQKIATFGSIYEVPDLTLFQGAIRGVCMESESLAGPFYCPADEHVYLDRVFLQQVAQRAGSATDLALAYLVGHDLGEHVQFLVGTTTLVEQARSSSTAEVSARTWAASQLQADCYAGLWVRWALMHRQIGSGEDAASALDAVAAVSQALAAHLPLGALVVDPVQTYGTAAQRLRWFSRGEDTGNFNDCDTFGAERAGTL